MFPYTQHFSQGSLDFFCHPKTIWENRPAVLAYCEVLWLSLRAIASFGSHCQLSQADKPQEPLPTIVSHHRKQSAATSSLCQLFVGSIPVCDLSAQGNYWIALSIDIKHFVVVLSSPLNLGVWDGSFIYDCTLSRSICGPHPQSFAVLSIHRVLWPWDCFAFHSLDSTYLTAINKSILVPFIYEDDTM